MLESTVIDVLMLMVGVTISVVMNLVTHSLNNRSCPSPPMIMSWSAVYEGLPLFPHPHHQLLLKVQHSLLRDEDKSEAEDNREGRHWKGHFHIILGLHVTEHLLEYFLHIRYEVKEARAHEDSTREAR